MRGGATAGPGREGVLRIVRGHPGDEEIAAAAIALLAVLASRRPAPASRPRAAPEWRGAGEFRPPGSWAAR
ncbi:acyl-CoA carboxylase epsilon subunit [Streptomyces reniochalinae]|uniref:Acyl-CoA carboxylase subunit epsilon n=1 Tax=Streptomyces reniochalinae TaxID=2250578 RepID=A0A367EDM1_9ACTN|nr:acyl-CoA carboxylase subunit epsilon [Streptomyces reniochalinae]